MISKDATERVDKIKRAASSEPRIGLTEFARSKSWRVELEKNDVMEIVDHKETAGFLLSKKGMQSLLETITSLEQKLEDLQIDALFTNRQDMINWQTGDKLADLAKKDLEKRNTTIKKVLNDNQ